MANEYGNNEVFANNLKLYMKYHNLDRISLSKKLDVPYTTLTDWLTAKKYPKMDRIEEIAKLFNITKSELIENTSGKVNERLILFYKASSLLNDDEWKIIKFILEEKIKDKNK